MEAIRIWIPIIATDCITTLLLIFLLKITTSSLFLATLIKFKKATAIVVVFTPPAVEPGEPPINISNVERIYPELLSLD